MCVSDTCFRYVFSLRASDMCFLLVLSFRICKMYSHGVFSICILKHSLQKEFSKCIYLMNSLNVFPMYLPHVFASRVSNENTYRVLYKKTRYVFPKCVYTMSFHDMFAMGISELSLLYVFS